MRALYNDSKKEFCDFRLGGMEVRYISVYSKNNMLKLCLNMSCLQVNPQEQEHVYKDTHIKDKH